MVLVPSLTLVAMLKLLLKLDAGVNVTPANNAFTSASAPLALHTPEMKVEVTEFELLVLSNPAVVFERVKVTVTLALSTSETTKFVKSSAVFCVYFSATSRLTAVGASSAPVMLVVMVLVFDEIAVVPPFVLVATITRDSEAAAVL
jgi:hypothetical protein